MRISDALISNIARQSMTRAQNAFLAANQPVLDQTSLPAPSTDLAKADRVGFLDRYDRELARFDTTRSSVRHDLSTAEIQLDGLQSNKGTFVKKGFFAKVKAEAIRYALA